MGPASAIVIGPFDENHLFYRCHIKTGVLFCNHLEAGCIWSVSNTANIIWQVDNGTTVPVVSNWTQDVNELAGGNEEYYLTIIDRGAYGEGITEDNRCLVCKQPLE